MGFLLGTCGHVVVVAGLQAPLADPGGGDEGGAAPEDDRHEALGDRSDAAEGEASGVGGVAEVVDVGGDGADQVRAEQARRRSAGEPLQLGVGIASYVEITGFGGKEYAGIRVSPDGHLTVMAGTSAHGQGHETAWSQIVADALGVRAAV